MKPYDQGLLTIAFPLNKASYKNLISEGCRVQVIGFRVGVGQVDQPSEECAPHCFDALFLRCSPLRFVGGHMGRSPFGG